MQALSKDSCPPWPCPICRKGTLALVSKSLVCQETTKSKLERSLRNEDWEPDWIHYNFTAWAECRHPTCGQRFAIAGRGSIEQNYDPEAAEQWVEYFAPFMCHPMPDMIELPSKCPAEVRDELRGAFSIFWLHGAACAGRIRVALEYLMDHLGISKKRRKKNGKYAALRLHDRIEAFAKKEASIGSQLMALKWLGNTGSHDRKVNKDDLLDAFEILEHALAEVIDRRSAKVTELAKKLARKHGR